DTSDWMRKYLRLLLQEKRCDSERETQMNRVNPIYVLRNYLAQQAIDQAEQGNYGEIENLMNVLRSPYNVQPGAELYAHKRPDWARHRAGCSTLSCSS
ncbi:MAG: hypothetical protein ABL921_21600, partial [Pirellula sp.]